MGGTGPQREGTYWNPSLLELEGTQGQSKPRANPPKMSGLNSTGELARGLAKRMMAKCLYKAELQGCSDFNALPVLQEFSADLSCDGLRSPFAKKVMV